MSQIDKASQIKGWIICLSVLKKQLKMVREEISLTSDSALEACALHPHL